MLAMRRLLVSVIGLGVYAYALWSIAVGVVWLGSLQAFKGITLSFGGATIETAVPLYQGMIGYSLDHLLWSCIVHLFNLDLFIFFLRPT